MSENRKLITANSLSSEAMEECLESEFGHFGALAVYALEAAAKAASALEIVSGALVVHGMNQAEVRKLIAGAATVPSYPRVKHEVGDICVAMTVRQWNLDAAGIEPEPIPQTEDEISFDTIVSDLEAMFKAAREGR